LLHERTWKERCILAFFDGTTFTEHFLYLHRSQMMLYVVTFTTTSSTNKQDSRIMTVMQTAIFKSTDKMIPLTVEELHQIHRRSHKLSSKWSDK